MSSQGRVEIKFITDTKELESAKQKINQFGQEIDNSLDGKSADGLTESISNIGNSSQKSTGGVRNLIGALGLLKVGAVALNAITDSIGDAVARVDTMNQYPKILEQMGFSAQESGKSVSRLSEGIQGLPTRLNDVVATSQRFVTTFRDVDKATETTLALNNALLASGASGQAAANSTDQYVKMLSSGKVEMDSWNTLTENMNYALVEVSAQMGYSSENTWELYDALKNGEVSLDDFNDALIEASTAQGGFAEVALTASEGIATSMANIRTAIVTGVANAIQALDDLVTDLTGKNIAKHFDTIKVAIADAFKMIASGIRNAAPYIRQAITLFKNLAPAIGVVTSAYLGMQIIDKVSKWIDTSNKAIKGAEIAKNGLTLATKGMTAAEIASSGALSASQIVYGALTGQISATTVATTALMAAKTALLSPLGIAVGLAAAVTAAYWGISAATRGMVDENNAFVESLESTSSKNQELAGQIESSKQAYDNQIESIRSNRDAQRELLDEIDALMAKESLSADEKSKLKANIDELNNSIGQTVLKYDEETGAVEGSVEAIRKRIDALEDQETAEAALQRRQELRSEIISVNAQIAETEQKIIEGREKMAEMDWVERGFTDNYNNTLIAVQELEKEQESLIETQSSLNAEMEYTTDIYTEATAAAEEQTRTAVEGAEEQAEAVKMTVEEIKKLADEWENMSLTEKQVKVETMGQEEIEELMQLLGVDLESLPSEYHKDAYLNAHGYDALEELLFLTGEWENLTLEEKRVVLEAQVSTGELLEVIEARDLWNDEKFITQLAEIDMNDNDAEQRVLNLINQWGELEGLEPIEVEIDTRQVQEAAEATNTFQVAWEDLSEDQQAVVEQIQGYYTDLRDHTQNMFDEINDTIMTTTDAGDEVAKSSAEIFAEMQSTLEHNQEVVSTWADNMAELAQRGVDKGLLEELARLGPEGAPYVQALVDASDAELAQLSETFSQGGEEALDALQEALGLEDFEIEGLENVITNAEESLREQIESSGLSEIGGDIVETLSRGLEDGTEQMQEAGSNLMTGAQQGLEEAKPDFITANTNAATEAFDAFKAAAGVASPSTLYSQAAADMVAGAVQGMNNNKPTFVETARATAKEAIDAFDSFKMAARSAGANLGNSFNDGLASRRSAIVATARSIANAAADAINRALEIRSPSRRGIYSGEMLGLGLEVGMEGQLQDIEKMADKIGQSAIPNIDPIDINRALSMPYFKNINSSPVSSVGKANTNSDLLDALNRLANKDTNIVLDDGTLVGKLGPKYDRFYGDLIKDKKRWGG